MSSVSKDEPKIHEIYTQAYSLIRQYRNYAYLDVFAVDFQRNPHIWNAVIFAILSYNNRDRKLDGWQNPLRAAQFRTRNPKADIFSDIPF